MERSWVETIRLLGLDVVILVTGTLAVAEWAIRQARARALRRRPARRSVAAGGSAAREALSA
jgi:hypothetical protein